ncbi:MAG: pilin [Candidatus Paceibacterota bacterium]
MQKIQKYIPIAMVLAPSLAFARSVTDIISGTIMPIINAIIPLLIAVAVVLFLFGVVKFITSAGDEEKRKEARSFMLYGIIGIFVMVSVWGLVGILSDTLGLGTSSNVRVPGALPQ